MTTYKLYTGGFDHIGAEYDATIAADPAWIVAQGDLKDSAGNLVVLVARPADESEYQDIAKMLANYADGAFASWTPDMHYPRRPVEAPEGWAVVGGTLPKSSAIKGAEIDTMKFEKGAWYEYLGGNALGKCAAKNRIDYHDRVRHLQLGGTLAVGITGYLRNGHALKLVENLNAGTGNVLAARETSIEESQARKQAWKAETTLRMNGRQPASDTKTKEPEKPVLLVKSLALRSINMYEQKPGSVWNVLSANGTKQHETEWNPTDALLVDTWKAYATMPALRFEPAS